MDVMKENQEVMRKELEDLVEENLDIMENLDREIEDKEYSFKIKEAVLKKEVDEVQQRIEICRKRNKMIQSEIDAEKQE